MNKLLEELKKLKDVYNEVREFEVGKQLKVKIKVLTSEEETAVHTYAMGFEQGLAYLYSVKRETLCKAIIAMNGKDIPEEIVDAEGKTERHIWLRENVVCGWSQMLVDQVWNKYAELILTVEDKLGKDIVEESKKESK
jgi:hypothetical protein